MLLKLSLSTVKRNWRVYFGIGIGLVIMVGIIIVILNKTTTIPKEVMNKTAFTVFYPKAQNTIIPAASTIQYNTANNALSYAVDYSSTRLWVSEQAVPDVFSQPGVYEFKLGQAHQYATFSSRLGNVYLTSPDELRGQTLAWLTSDGTLTLVRGPHSFTGAQWRLLFNSMQRAD